MSGGRFKPGTSGNPAGRKPGTGEVAKLRQGIAKHIPAITRKLVQQAKAGDVQAARLLFERVIPPLKAAEHASALPLPDGTLTQQGRAVLAAAAAGEIAAGQAAQLVAALSALASLTGTDELAARIAALEARHAAR